MHKVKKQAGISSNLSFQLQLLILIKELNVVKLKKKPINLKNLEQFVYPKRLLPVQIFIYKNVDP